MRTQLENEINMLLMSQGFDTEDVRARLVLILNKYEITERCTEVAVLEEDAIEKYIKLFIVNKRIAGLSPRTLKYYSNTLHNFFRDCPKSPLDVTADDIKLYLAIKETQSNWSKCSLQNFTRVAGSFFGWMVNEDHISKSPMSKVSRVKIPKVKKKAFDEMEIEKLRQACKTLKEKMTVELLLSTGCRVGEIVLIRIDEFSTNFESVIVHGKGAKDRIVYLNAKAQLAIMNYLNKKTDTSPYLYPKCLCTVANRAQFKNLKKLNSYDWNLDRPDMVDVSGMIDVSVIEYMIRKLGKRAGVEKVHPHRFRRTCATMALRRGMPIEQVSKMLGHESIETTQIYLDLSEDELSRSHKKFVI